MGIRAARLAAVALAAIAGTAAGCRRSPVAGRSGDAGGGTIGAPSVGDAAREPLDAGVETLADASTDADVIRADAPGDAPSADAPADAPLDVADPDAPANHDAPSDRMLGDRSDVRAEDQPCGPQGFICAPFACDVARGVCKSTCATNDDCVTGQACNDGLCGVRTPAFCSSSDECRSGHCAQGVCCNAACTGPCVSCALPTAVGTCVPAPAGVLDPTGVCPAGGTCNGRGACVPPICAIDSDCGALYLCNDAHCVPCNATCTTSADCNVGVSCIMRNSCTYCSVADAGAGL